MTKKKSEPTGPPERDTPEEAATNLAALGLADAGQAAIDEARGGGSDAPVSSNDDGGSEQTSHGYSAGRVHPPSGGESGVK